MTTTSTHPGAGLNHAAVTPLAPERFAALLSGESLSRFEHTIARGRELMAGRTLWTVNSTARGGGVAEILRPLIGYLRGAGLDARWVVIGGGDEFFRSPSGSTTGCTAPTTAVTWASRSERSTKAAASPRPSGWPDDWVPTTSCCFTTRRPRG